MLIGYARVSTEGQKLDLQEDALRKAGCERMFHDMASGARTSRPGLTDALAQLREGDTLVVWKLDRLGRSIKHLIDTVTTLEQQGIAFQSIQEGIDTQTSGGKLVFHIFGALAEFERDLIRERTNAGLEAARARGRTGGRPVAFGDEKDIRLLKKMHESEEFDIKEICNHFGISRATLYKYLKSG